MHKLFLLIEYSLLIPFNLIWYIQLIIPRNENIWIFGAWFGQKYSDNSKSLFEFVKKNDNSVKAIWLTKNNDIKLKLQGEGIKCYHSWSLKGVWYSLIAGNVIFSSGKEDVNSFFINGARTYQLWHGAPMKKIGLDDKFAHNKWIDLFKKLFLPFIFEYNVNFVVSTSEIFNDKLSTAFSLKNNKIIKSGYPRNDIFFNKTYTHPIVEKWNTEFKSPTKILYLPTFRDSSYDTDLYNKYNFSAERMSKLLNKINGLFITKGHYVDNHSGLEFNSSRIINLTNDAIPEINPILKDIDILLTDYSGAYFDFLLTDKPIIFTPFDFNEYISKNRELYFDYNDILAGPISKNWIDVENNILEVLEVDNYIELRMKMNKQFNSYNKGDSSKKLHEFIKNS